MAINESGDKMYELSNHLGNVLNVVADRKLPVQLGSTGTVNYYVSNVMSYSDYYPFGALLPGRHTNETSYRYGAANGQEKVDEISGSGNHYSAEYWEYDSRLARRWNQDPVVKHHESPYACFANNPIFFMDPNGADTLNYQNTIKSAKFTNAVNALNKSAKYREFFQSFISGSNSDLKLEFKSVNNLRTTDKKTKLDGQVQLLYQGKHIVDLTKLPINASLEDFTILVELDSDIRNRVEGGDYTNARKGVTLAHEMFVHVISATSMIRAATNSDGTVDLQSLQSTYISTMEDDHKKLYSGKNKDFMDVANEVVAAQSNMMSQYSQSIGNTPENVQNGTRDLEKNYGEMIIKKHGRNYFAHFTYKQLWRYVFNDNMKPMPIIK